MSADTITTKKIIDTTQSPKFITEKTTIERTIKSDSDYIVKSLDFITSIAWPLIVLILFLCLKNNLIQLFHALIDKIKSSDNINISKNGITFSSSKEEIENHKMTQSGILPEIGDIDDYSKRILSTLWTRQLEFDSSFNNRWTFTLGNNHPDYLNFPEYSKRLRIVGLATLALTTGQIFLTDIGIKFCQKYSTEIKNTSLIFC